MKTESKAGNPRVSALRRDTRGSENTENPPGKDCTPTPFRHAFRANLRTAKGITEISVFKELRALKRAPIFQGEGIPKLDHKPIVIIPGLGGFRLYKGSIDAWLERIGCRPFVADLTFGDHTVEMIVSKIDSAVEGALATTGRKPVILGYSLGYMQAMLYTSTHHDKVDSIISIGGPKNSPLEVNAALYGILWGISKSGIGLEIITRLVCECAKQPKVPVVSIFSKRDGAIKWDNTIIPGGRNVEVRSSHLGFLLNSEVYWEIANILSC